MERLWKSQWLLPESTGFEIRRLLHPSDVRHVVGQNLESDPLDPGFEIPPLSQREIITNLIPANCRNQKIVRNRAQSAKLRYAKLTLFYASFMQ